MKSFSIYILTILILIIKIHSADAGNIDKSKTSDTDITITGTIQGLKSTMAGITYTFGEEEIVRSFEDTYVLVTEDSDWFLIPTIPNDLLSANLNKRFQVTGKLILGGKAIDARLFEICTANGNCEIIWPAVYKNTRTLYKDLKIFPLH